MMKHVHYMSIKLCVDLAEGIWTQRNARKQISIDTAIILQAVYTKIRDLP